MQENWWVALLLFCWLPSYGFASVILLDSTLAPAFTLELVQQPDGYFIPGDEVILSFLPKPVAQPLTDSFTLAAKLPVGLFLNDAFWEQRGRVVFRKLPAPIAPEPFPVSLKLRINDNFKGRHLTVEGYFAAFPDERERVVFSVAEVLSRQLDTCFYFQDTTAGNATSIVATRTAITARLRGPVDLSPKAPLRISHGKCKAFVLKPGKKRDKTKEKCTALRYLFSDSIKIDYPDRYEPTAKKVKGIVDFSSSGNIGDSLQVTLKTTRGKPLRGLVLTNEAEEILDAQSDVAGYNFSVVLDTAFLNRTLHLRARRLFGILPVRQYCLVDAERRTAPQTFYRANGPPLQQPGGDTILLASTIIGNSRDTTVWKDLTVRRYDSHTVFYQIERRAGKSAPFAQRLDTLQRDTCDGLFDVRFGAKKIKQHYWAPIDTLLYQAADAVATVVGLRNPMGNQAGNIEVKIPLSLDIGSPETRDSLMAVAYWIGIGAVPITNYDTLAESVPPEWAQPGVSAPLAAYGLGHPLVLPDLGTSEEKFQSERVRYNFVRRNDLSRFTAQRSYAPVIKRNDGRPNYGLISGRALSALSSTPFNDPVTGKKVVRFYLAYANRHDINTYPLQLHVVAYYRVYGLKDKWVKVAPSP